MKTQFKPKLFVTVVFLLLATISFSQNGKKHPPAHPPHPMAHPHPAKHPPSKYRPKQSIVFHPVWGPHKNYNRRWVYFPNHSCYWDNWRNVYFYKQGGLWISSAKKPTFLIKVDLEKEKQYELKETDDDDDEIYNANGLHQTEYK